MKGLVKYNDDGDLVVEVSESYTFENCIGGYQSAIRTIEFLVDTKKLDKVDIDAAIFRLVKFKLNKKKGLAELKMKQLYDKLNREMVNYNKK